MSDDIVARLRNKRAWDLGNLDEMSEAADEIVRLRAKLAAELGKISDTVCLLRQMEGNLHAAEAERDALRAELAAEREAYFRLSAQTIDLRAERDALRAALQYARNLIGPDEIIDAALNKGGGDGPPSDAG